MTSEAEALASPYMTEERLMFQDLARTFTRDEVTPVANLACPREVIHLQC